MQKLKMIVLSGLVLGLMGCATLAGDPHADLDILDTAMTSRVEDLQPQADGGVARAQLALAVVYRFGLNGTPKNLPAAFRLRQKATAQRGYLPITQYIAGLNGAPGRTAIINIPRYDLTEPQAARVYACAEALEKGQVNSSGFSACGSEPRFRDLHPRWQAISPGAKRPDLKPKPARKPTIA
ncbi:hypothetical protein PQU92_13075 [Asticcacaulis sp. BYS171W]|uniref:Pilus assembly protein CpaD n=1 Tax=Asticcacaulis aquaticus TaxID=2984212 RepID=A0ABT5HWA6_9CAUL|nr:hypothetical protein [Asticcacaulis aquaticus]MDC7684217.1 hypothetical protein [Asticcacaulis aquaticus]